LTNCGRKLRASSRFTSVRPVKVWEGVDLADNPLHLRRLAGVRREHIRRQRPPIPVADDEAIDQVAEAVGRVAVVAEAPGRIEQARQPRRKRIERAGREAAGQARALDGRPCTPASDRPA
jgi:hypothetical protein